MNCTKQSDRYYLALRPQTNETYPVHKEGCPFMPDDRYRIYLGIFSSGLDAGIEGKKYTNVSCTCRYCSKEAISEKTGVPAAGSSLFPTENQLLATGELTFRCCLN